MIWPYILAASAVFFFALWVILHRDPDRKTHDHEGYLSPADGYVNHLQEVTDTHPRIQKHKYGITAMLDDFPQGKTIIIIDIKIWNVHTQRAPIDGTVLRVHHKEANTEGAEVENEHVSITIKGEKKSCKIYLIGGIGRSRIIPLVKIGERVKQGDRIGRIRWGSEAAIILPRTDEILVKDGSRVHAGRTPIAK